MPFIEFPTFPLSIARGAVGGPGFATAVSPGLAGDEARAGFWEEDLGSWEVGLVHKNETLTRELLAFWYCVAKGRANAFRFRDFQPGEHTGVQEYLGTGDGANRIFQLRKWYASGEETYSKTIYKPVAGTVHIFLNGVETTAFTLNTVTGRIRLASPVGVGIIVRANFTFDKPVRAAIDWLQMRAVDRRVFSWESIPLVEVRDPAIYLALSLNPPGPPVEPAAWTEHWEFELSLFGNELYTELWLVDM
jgi:uncharacterized protein (TIGR02217 family)